jgi:hypothetical protein
LKPTPSQRIPPSIRVSEDMGYLSASAILVTGAPLVITGLSMASQMKASFTIPGDTR